ncbi:phasin family protein [Brevundimonas sp. A19_0]|uniref:phasin family protein n=1 Tax=Brevundimonas sp. A19_0 TaxID=2821087 RepID=UPI001FD7E10F|nr:phasin family protein [Brevundimonas sp. A19_0]
MTSPRSMTRDGKRMARNARTALTTASDSQDMLTASSDVIAARMEIMARAMADPLRADIGELSLMGTEKLEALSASAASLTGNMGTLAARASKSALAEVDHARRAAVAVSSAPTPAAAATAQFNYALGWWGRAASQMMAFNSGLLKTQAEALKPLHDKATANARRLKR